MSRSLRQLVNYRPSGTSSPSVGLPQPVAAGAHGPGTGRRRAGAARRRRAAPGRAGRRVLAGVGADVGDRAGRRRAAAAAGAGSTPRCSTRARRASSASRRSSSTPPGSRSSAELVELQRSSIRRSAACAPRPRDRARHAARGRHPARPPRSARSRASRARSARRSAAARPSKLVYVARGRRGAQLGLDAALPASRRARPTSPARSCASAPAPAPPARRLGAPAGRHGRAGHRRVARDRRGDRRRCSRATARTSSASTSPRWRDDLDAVTGEIGGSALHARHHRRGRAAARSPTHSRRARRRRRRRPQRRRHSDRRSARMPRSAGTRDGRQPARAGAHQRGAARARRAARATAGSSACPR